MIKVLSFLSNENCFEDHSRGPLGPPATVWAPLAYGIKSSEWPEHRSLCFELAASSGYKCTNVPKQGYAFESSFSVNAKHWELERILKWFYLIWHTWQCANSWNYTHLCWYSTRRCHWNQTWLSNRYGNKAANLDAISRLVANATVGCWKQRATYSETQILLSIHTVWKQTRLNDSIHQLGIASKDRSACCLLQGTMEKNGESKVLDVVQDNSRNSCWPNQPRQRKMECFSY